MNVLRCLLCGTMRKGDASLVERESLPTYYPKTGFGGFPEKIADAVLVEGARIHLGCRVSAVSDIGHGTIVVGFEKNGELEETEGTHVVSTIPINQLVPMLHPSPPPEVLASAQRIEHRGLLFLGMIVGKQQILSCGYTYVLHKPYCRITEMNEFSPSTSPADENILGVEIPTQPGSPIWEADKKTIFGMCIGSLAQQGFLQERDVRGLMLVKSPSAYPIYRKGYARHLGRVLGYIESNDRVFSLGRNGGFRYMDVDECIRRGLRFGNALLSRFGISQDE